MSLEYLIVCDLCSAAVAGSSLSAGRARAELRSFGGETKRGSDVCASCVRESQGSGEGRA